MDGFDGHQGMSKLANVLVARIKQENESPLVLDFGEIQANGSLLTDTFPVPIPKGDYSVCRHLILGMAGDTLAITEPAGKHGHDGVMQSTEAGEHTHIIKIPEKMRSIAPGDRVLVAWVQSEAVVIDIIKQS